MTTSTKSPHVKSSQSKSPPSQASMARQSAASSKATDAIALLKADHAEVKKCFQAYQKLVDADGKDSERRELAEQICTLLTVHATIEEEIFYPAARDALEDDASLVDEADVEHASAKQLIAQIQAMEPSEDHFDACIKVLGEYIDHHVKEEQDEMFPKCKAAKLDLKELGAQLQARKEELMGTMAEA